MKPATLLVALLAPCCVQAAAVFAHFMVGNTAKFGLSDWESNMNLAIEAHIDAFALNMAYGWPQNYDALALAFQAAANTKFQLFFSFDYAGNGSWPLGDVRDLITQYGGSGNYYKYQGKPFVSTFEGPDNAEDWVTIKQDTGCFFMPDWSSLGAGPAMAAANGVADGLFSWAAWAYGELNMTTYVDASYNLTLTQVGGKPYMMPVSPWFYTNLPGYNKNWAWRGDNLWYDRWLQVWTVKPEFVEIISWNDFGESHYIGPLDDRQYDAFTIGEAPFNYVEGMPHDAWRAHLPFIIDTYKDLNPSIGTESMVAWYRKSPGAKCQDGGTTGNTAQQLQFEYEPSEIFQDRIFIAALLASPADFELTDGEHLNDLVTDLSEWDYVPDGGVGIYQMSRPIDSMLDMSGSFRALLYRLGGIQYEPGDGFITADSNVTISSTCELGLTNWNPVTTVGYSKEGTTDAKAELKLSEQGCIEGYARSLTGNFNELCQFTCKYDYCPIGACVCTKLGKPLERPQVTTAAGYPANGDDSYSGICSFACTYGFCPSDVCSTSPQPQYIPDNSPFENIACTDGHYQPGFEGYDGLCSYACNYGFCPMHVCSCTKLGYLNVPPSPTAAAGKSQNGDDAGLCNFACSRGYCPEPCFYDLALTFPDDSCSVEQKAMINSEMGRAYDIARAAFEDVTFGNYYKIFFSQDLTGDEEWMANLPERYRRMADILSGTSKIYPLTATCIDNKENCGTKGWMAFMSDSQKRVNFCPSFFSTEEKNGQSSQFVDTLLNQCDSINIRHVGWSKGAIIVHESAHTSYAMLDGAKAIDVAYGYTDCAALPKGGWKRDCKKYGKKSKPVCPDANGNEGECDQSLSGLNADTYSMVAAGIYFSKKCNKNIPLPGTSSSSSMSRRDVSRLERMHPRELSQVTGSALLQGRSNSCPYVTDAWVIDGDAGDDTLTITGLTHFGDSYASGMGTGTTSGDSCRVGSSNYGQLIYNFISDSSVSYQRLSCSGDTTDDLSAKIDGWTTMASTTVATLTIGGNDVYFSDIVWNCVITPNTARLPSTYRSYCLDFENKAIAHMQDTSDQGLPAKLKNVYIKILQKSGREDLGLYVAGYPEFFNNETTTCEWSTFHYWWAGYKSILNWDPRMVFLTQAFRTEMNGLVNQLNSVIQAAVNAANNEWGGSQITFVDLVEPWRADDDHRWCATNDVKEPDSSRSDTWFFLSGWSDVDNAASAAQDSSDLSALVAAGGINLPDGATCNATLGTGPDPWAWWLCQMAQEILESPNGDLANNYNQVNADIRNGDYTATNVSGWYPTRQIKTFHPRTPGMYGYRDAVVQAMQFNGQI